MQHVRRVVQDGRTGKHDHANSEEGAELIAEERPAYNKHERAHTAPDEKAPQEREVFARVERDEGESEKAEERDGGGAFNDAGGHHLGHEEQRHQDERLRYHEPGQRQILRAEVLRLMRGAAGQPVDQNEAAHGNQPAYAEHASGDGLGQSHREEAVQQSHTAHHSAGQVQVGAQNERGAGVHIGHSNS